MATLPPLFYAACLCTRRAIIVGDPRQLPPIVQSDDERVRRAIGRNVFDVTVPDPERSEVVAMLDVQYRMHPAIGALVGRLFYGGRLVHAAEPPRSPRSRRARRFPASRSSSSTPRSDHLRARRRTGSSRVNPASAEITADLALEAVRGGATSIAVITPYAAQARRDPPAARGAPDRRRRRVQHDPPLPGPRVRRRDHRSRRRARRCGRARSSRDAPNLLNVSISRARGKLVIVADVAYFTAASRDGIVSTLLRDIAMH